MPLFKKRLNAEQKRLLDKKILLAQEKPDLIYDLADIGLYEIFPLMSELLTGYVPEGVYSVCKVLQKEALLLQNNKLESLKGGGHLADLSHVKVLDLSHNKLSKLEKEFGSLANLQRLDLSYNNLKDLPACVCKCKTLEVLDLRGNDLQSLPPEIKSLKQLRSLDIRENPFLTHLSVNLCFLFELSELLFDFQTVCYPAKEITSQGVAEIKRWLSLIKGEEFTQEYGNTAAGDHCTTLGDIQVTEDETAKFEEAILQREKEKELQRKQRLELEHQILDAHAENALLISNANYQRQRVLSQVAFEEMKNQSEIVKQYEDIERNRKKLISELKSEDDVVNDTVSLVLQMTERARNTEALLEELEQDRQRLDELVSITTEESERLRKEDIVRAMGIVLQDMETHQNLWQKYADSQIAMRNSALKSSAQSDENIEMILGERDSLRKDLIHRIATEEEAQKQAVQILQSQKDAKLNRIRKQIEMVEAELLRLSRLETEKRKEAEEREMQTLSEMRVNTALLLSTLIDEQERREKQLVDRLLEMERLREDQAKDFWLIQYQRLLDSKPHILIDEENQLDVFIVETLLNAGAKEYLPMFARNHVTKENFITMKDDELIKIGVHDEYVRESIRASIKNHLLMDEKTEKAGAAMVSIKDSGPIAEPSAPSARREIMGVTSGNECVVCLDHMPGMIFLPCGHICTCPDCAFPLDQCPLCRQTISQKCRLYLP